jgi:long-chain acyl-CoA synthetase
MKASARRRGIPQVSESEIGNVADLVRRAAQLWPGKAALIDGPRQVTWGELDDRVDRAAVVFHELGLRPGDRVVLALGNTLEFPMAYFGALRAGLVATPTNTANTSRELDHVLQDSAASAVLIGPAAAAAFDEVLAGRAEPLLVLNAGGALTSTGRSFEDLLETTVASAPSASAAAGEDLAVLMYTSGTSGKPRGAMLSHRALLADLDHVSRIEPAPTELDDVVLLVLPMFHIFGLNSGLGMVVRAGATGVLSDRFDPVGSVELIRRHGVTGLVGAPPMYVAWSLLPDAAEAFATVRLAVSGAAPLSREVLMRFATHAGHRIYEGYGLTETSPSVTSTLCSFEPKPGSIGRPVPGVELQLVDRSGNEVEPDDPGEVRVRGDNLFSGYWPDGREGPDAEGWWCTGDVAVADEAGDLTLVDRRGDLILVSGFNVYPREVETVLATHPDVAEVAVIGIPHPYTGEAVKALVVPQPGATLSIESLLVHAGRSLARFKCPTAVEVVESLPHTATGKVSKGRLRDVLGGPR